MLELLGTLAWAGVACYAIWRFAPVVEKFAPVRGEVPEDERFIDVPDDLAAFAASLQDEWAVEDTIKVIKERYADLRDWNRVRAAMGIGVLPETA